MVEGLETSRAAVIGHSMGSFGGRFEGAGSSAEQFEAISRGQTLAIRSPKWWAMLILRMSASRTEHRVRGNIPGFCLISGGY